MPIGISGYRKNTGLPALRPRKEYSGFTPVDEALSERCKKHADAACNGLEKKVNALATIKEKLEFLSKCKKRFAEISKGKRIEWKDAWANKFGVSLEELEWEILHLARQK